MRITDVSYPGRSVRCPPEGLSEERSEPTSVQKSAEGEVSVSGGEGPNR